MPEDERARPQARPHRDQPGAARHRRHHRRRHLRADRARPPRSTPGPRIVALVRARRARLPLRRALLRRVRVDDPGGGQRVHLRLRHAGRAGGLDHRLGPDPRVPLRRLHGRGGLVGLLHGVHGRDRASRCRRRSRARRSASRARTRWCARRSASIRRPAAWRSMRSAARSIPVADCVVEGLQPRSRAAQPAGDGARAPASPRCW